MDIHVFFSFFTLLGLTKLILLTAKIGFYVALKLLSLLWLSIGKAATLILDFLLWLYETPYISFILSIIADVGVYRFFLGILPVLRVFYCIQHACGYLITPEILFYFNGESLLDN